MAKFQKQLWVKFAEIIFIACILYVLGGIFCFAVGGGYITCGSLLHGLILFGVVPIMGILRIPVVEKE